MVFLKAGSISQLSRTRSCRNLQVRHSSNKFHKPPARVSTNSMRHCTQPAVYKLYTSYLKAMNQLSTVYKLSSGYYYKQAIYQLSATISTSYSLSTCNLPGNFWLSTSSSTPSYPPANYTLSVSVCKQTVTYLRAISQLRTNYQTATYCTNNLPTTFSSHFPAKHQLLTLNYGQSSQYMLLSCER
jgi:hypothetical protein